MVRRLYRAPLLTPWKTLARSTLRDSADTTALMASLDACNSAQQCQAMQLYLLPYCRDATKVILSCPVQEPYRNWLVVLHFAEQRASTVQACHGGSARCILHTTLGAVPG